MQFKMYKFFALLLLCSFWANQTQAQRTIELRVTTVTSNGDDMDGFGSGDSDFQWDFEAEDECGEQSGSGSHEASGVNCPPTQTLNNTFFSRQYDCDLPAIIFSWRGMEDDGVGSDANTGYQNITLTSSTLSLLTGTFTNINTYTATASGTRCGGGATVTYTLTLQARVLGTRMACTADACATPLVLPSPASYVCGNAQTNTTLNTTLTARQSCGRGSVTPSASSITCSVQRTPPQDVWVRTRIPANTGGAIIQFENLGGCTGTLCVTNVSYAWYTSSNGLCTGLQYRGCGSVSCFFGCGNGQIRVDGRAGEDVWVRIWEADDQGFSIRFNQISPTPPADRCYTALPISAIGCNYGATSDDNGTYAEPDLPSWTSSAHPAPHNCQDGDHNVATPNNWASNENLVWHTYTQPATGAFSIAVDNMACVGGQSNAQIGLFRNLGTPASPTCDLATSTGMGCAVGAGAVELVLPSLAAGNYIIVVDGNAGAECAWTFKDRINGTLLAVDFINVDARTTPKDKSVILDWTTTRERNHKGFEVQRSVDGLHFNTLTFVDAHLSGIENAYTYEDEDLPMASTIYYRLRQVDFDGQAMFSKVVSVNTNLVNTGTSVVHEIYPNPAQHEITIPFITAKDDVVNVYIYDIRGNMILQAANDRAYKAGQHFLNVSLPSDLPKGLYIMRFDSQQGTQVKKFVIE